MKCTFFLRYHTKYGESLFVKGTAAVLGKDKNPVVMRYLNTDYWHLEIEINSKEWKKGILQYAYLLKTLDGEFVEEAPFPRQIHLNENFSAYSIYDVWNAAGLYDNVFFTEPFKKILLPRHKSSKENLTSRPSHRFRIKAPLLKKGEVVCLLGNVAPLGNWDEQEPIILKFDGDSWLADLNLTGIEFPIAYKYGIYTKKKGKFIGYENGDNRISFDQPEEQKMIHLQDGFLNVADNTWRAAGVSIPVFSLRSKSGLGIGEFNDLKLLADWTAETGLRLIQILPVNDATASFSWRDSYPYSAISAFALHPIYINLETIAGKHHKHLLSELKSIKKELNKLDKIDYERVLEVKLNVLHQFYDADSKACFETDDYQSFFESNKIWLTQYAAYCYFRDKHHTANPEMWGADKDYNKASIEQLFTADSEARKEGEFYFFVQYHLHVQLRNAAQYLHEKGIVLKGDIPIGVNRTGCDAWVSPELYRMELQAGAPPDDFAISGQNWGFPTYNWPRMQQDGFAWWRERFTQMSHYFDAFRIDHILGFFRIWSIPIDQLEGTMGVFDPCIAMHVQEFNDRGVWFDYERFCTPYITDEVLIELFGDKASLVKELYLQRHGPFQYLLLPQFNAQRKVEQFLNANPEKDLDGIRTGLYKLISNVLLFEKPGSDKTQYNFRISIDQTSSFRHLMPHIRDIMWELYIDYFYLRQNYFWRIEAMKKLPQLKAVTNMLVCGEDLGMVPETVPVVMNELGILSLEIQRMPKRSGIEFFNPAHAPYLSVVTPSTHDMSTVRGWWEEDSAATQRFFNNEMGQQGDAPEHCETWVCRSIILQHLYSPAMWSIFQIQDLLGMSEKFRVANPEDERINIPANPNHYWHYRMPVTLEHLIKEEDFNKELETYIDSSGRGL